MKRDMPQLLFVVEAEQVFHSGIERFCQIHGESEGGAILALLETSDCLSSYIDEVREIGLLETPVSYTHLTLPTTERV